MNQAWVADALCIEYPHIAFFPERGQSLEPAKIICADCLVRGECLAFAIEHGIDLGIWGGMSAQERAKLGRAKAA